MDWRVFNDTLKLLEPEEHSGFTNLFISECEKDLEVIQAAEANAVVLSKTCHRLIGRAMQLGCVGVVKAARTLQAAAKAGDMAAISIHRDDLRATWEVTRALFKQL